MIQLKHRGKTRKTPLVLAFVFALVSLVSLLAVTAPVANAADPTPDQCYLKFNNQEVTYSELSAPDQAMLNQCLGKNCKYNGEGTNIGSKKIACTNPSAPSPEASGAAAAAETVPLVKLACGPNPVGGGENALSAYVACADKVRAIYTSCNTTGGGVTGAGTETPANVAKCAVPKINAAVEVGTNITVAAATTAIQQGRNDAATILENDANATAKKACEDQGGTFANGKCTPKSEEKTCSGGALGWVICPIISGIGGVNDAIFYMIEQQLFINPVSVQYNGPLYKIWTTFRDIANISFVIAFIVVIYSQATGAGLSSYGVKKMLPRIIVTAILVNISFFLCQIALDVSNIIGKSLGDLTASVLNGAHINVDIISWDSLVAALIAGGAVFGVGTAIVGAGGIAAAAALLLPFAVTAMFAALTAIVVLIARQAIIILLIAVAPLAFVAYLLPNTAKYFERWRELFTTMLVLYPLVAMLFAGSKLASWILLNAGSNGAEVSPLMLLTAIMILFLPLFGVPLLLKFSGGLLGRIGAFVNNPNKGPFDQLKKRATQKSDTLSARAAGRNLSKPRPNFEGKRFGRTRKALNGMTFAGAARSSVDRERDLNEAKQSQDKASGAYYAKRVTEDQKYAERMAGGGRFNEANPIELQRIKTTAQAAEKKAFNERVGSYQLSYSLDPKGADVEYLKQQFSDAVDSNNLEQASAAINRMSGLGGGGRKAVREALVSKEVANPDMQQAINNSILEDNYGALVGRIGDVAKGGFQNNRWSTTGTLSKVSSEQLATQDFDTLDGNRPDIKVEEAYRIINDQELRSKIQDTRSVKLFEEIARGYTPPPPGSAPSGGAPSGGAPSGGTGGSPSGGTPSSGGTTGGGGSPSSPAPSGGTPTTNPGSGSTSSTTINDNSSTVVNNQPPQGPPPRWTGSPQTFTGGAGPSAIPTTPPDLGYQGETRINRDEK